MTSYTSLHKTARQYAGAAFLYVVVPAAVVAFAVLLGEVVAR